MTNPDREELVKLDEAGLEAAVRECARITAPEITDDEYEQIKTDNSPRYQNTRMEMARAIRAYLRAAKPTLSSIVTCCVTGAIPGDGGACGDCDPCLLGEASVPAPVKTLIAEKNSLLHRVGELEDELESLRRLACVKGEPEPVADWRDDPTSDERWNAGCDFAMTQLCKALDVDPATVNWDAATETVDGDVQSVIWNILRARMGEDWDPTTAPPADAGMREAYSALCLPRESQASDNLEGALYDIERLSAQGKPTDDICIRTLKRVLTQIVRAEQALTAPGATTKSDGVVEGHADSMKERPVLSRADVHMGDPMRVQEAGIKPGPSDTRPTDVSVGELAGFFVTEFPHLLTMSTQIEVARALLDQFEIRRRP